MPVNQAQLDDIITEAAKHLGPEVVHVAYQIRPDSTGERSIFFRVVLADSSIRSEMIGAVARRVRTLLIDAVRPLEDWGLLPYVNFRSKSEQDLRPDPDWA